ncbi:MAG: hypothetical protein DCC65_04770 [Planctomycetota bacterium]|nr:MAG: hypothetical protein DCC65_04770 [Planctomycetota bacterium]
MGVVLMFLSAPILRTAMNAQKSAVIVAAFTGLISTLGFSERAAANIDLVLSPPQTIVAWDGGNSTIVEISLFAQTDQSSDECFSSIELILDYDPAFVELVGFDSSGNNYGFVLEGFLPDPDGINSSIGDGDALYTAGGFGAAYTAPPAPGALVTKFQFRIIAATSGTVIDYLPSSGFFGLTQVLECPMGGGAAENILGTVSTALIRTIDCSAGGPDADSDGFPDSCDNCDNNANPDQADRDGDGAGDACDGCPDDPNKTEPGVCGCGAPDVDSDSDGVPDCEDQCPGFDDNDDCDTDGVPDGCEADANSNGTPDDCESEDCDSDGTPDDQEEDCDGSGTPDDCEQLTDCNENGTPDICEDFADCNTNGTPDECERDLDTDGVIDDCDGCPTDPNKTEPGLCGCGVADTDTDSDGTPDCNDGCPTDPNKTEPGLCGCGVADTDTDSDGTPDCDDGCPNDPNKTEPGRCGCGVADTDTDSDGTPDCNDGCPADPNKTEPGLCGCGVADTDTDSDGTPDCNDGCPGDPNKTAPGVCGCGVADTDTDSDGTPDCIDGCPTNPDKIEPGICGCDLPDEDNDGDGVLDCEDQCEGHDDNFDCDSDGLPDGCEADCNTNGTPDDCEEFADCNTNGTPDSCELDRDQDGVIDDCDGCPSDPNKTSPGACGCGVADTDTEGDGVPDCNDVCPLNGRPGNVDAEGRPLTDFNRDCRPDLIARQGPPGIPAGNERVTDGAEADQTVDALYSLTGTTCASSSSTVAPLLLTPIAIIGYRAGRRRRYRS